MTGRERHGHQGRHVSERAEAAKPNVPEHGSVEDDLAEHLVGPLDLEDARRALVVPRRRKSSDCLGLEVGWAEEEIGGTGRKEMLRLHLSRESLAESEELWAGARDIRLSTHEVVMATKTRPDSQTLPPRASGQGRSIDPGHQS